MADDRRKKKGQSSGSSSYSSGRSSGRSSGGSGSGGRRSAAGGSGEGGRRSSGRSSGGYGSKGASSGSSGSTSGDRDRTDTDRAGRGGTQRRRDLRGAAAQLPNWVVEDLARVTPEKKVGAALEALGAASVAFEEGRYQRALRQARTAKDLAPRDVTVREILGLAAYRSGDWQTALAELRTYRRLAGETTHLPVEMDVLRAMDRDEDVETAWQELSKRGGRPGVVKEGKVVYGSFLIDNGRITEARKLTDPGSTSRKPFEEDLRLWYVAARAAAVDGDPARAGELRNAILLDDPAFPGIDELERLIANAG